MPKLAVSVPVTPISSPTPVSTPASVSSVAAVPPVAPASRPVASSVATPTTARGTTIPPKSKLLLHSLPSLTPSISTPTDFKVAEVQDDAPEVTLTQELLEQIWADYIEVHKSDSRRCELLQNRKLVLIDQNNFDILVPNMYMETEFHDIQNDLVDFIRKRSRHQLLKFKLKLEVEDKPAKTYMPREKYDAMLKINPNLAVFKKLFSDIDF